MTTLREAAQQALEVLVRASSYYDTYAEIAALEAALAEPTVPSDCTDSHQQAAELRSLHAELERCKQVCAVTYQRDADNPADIWARVDKDGNVTHLDMDVCANGPHNAYTALALAIWNAALEEAVKYAVGEGNDVLADSIRELKK